MGTRFVWVMFVVMAWAAGGCSDDSGGQPGDAGPVDGAIDAPVDASPDAAVDASPDAAVDASPDASTDVDAGSPDAGPMGPQVEVYFPPAMSMTSSDSITVRGAASGVQAVRVAGVAATSSDGFATWQAVVSLVSGDNPLLVEYQDAGGGGFMPVTTLTARRVIITGEPVAMMSVGPTAVYFVDHGRDKVVIQDFVTGGQTLLTSDDLGNGAQIAWAMDLVADVANDRALLLNGWEANSLIAVDLATGLHSVVSNSNGSIGDPLVGAGIGFESPTAMALGASTLYVVDTGLDAVLTVNPASGDRAVLSDSATGSGPALVDPRSVAIHELSDRIFVGDIALDALFVVEVGTGDRVVLSAPGTGSGPALDTPSGLLFDTSENRVLVADEGRHALIAVDAASGDRTEVSGPTVGAGPAIERPRHVIRYGTGGQVLVLTPNRILAVDLATGNRSVVGHIGLGTGAAFDQQMYQYGEVQPDFANQRAFYLGDGNLVAIDLTTGHRTVVADDATGTGPSLDPSLAFVLDAAQDRALVTSRGSGILQILAVDLATGNRTVISDATTGTGVALSNPMVMRLDAPNNRVILLYRSSPNQYAVVAVDLATGDRTLLSYGGTGGGVSLLLPRGMVVHQDTAYIADLGAVSVVDVDLTTGLRTTACEPAPFDGKGAPFLEYDAATGQFLAAIGETSLIWRFNPLDCAAAELPNTGLAGSVSLRSLSLDRLRRVALAHDRDTVYHGWSAMLAIDVVTGERVVVTKE